MFVYVCIWTYIFWNMPASLLHYVLSKNIDLLFGSWTIWLSTFYTPSMSSDEKCIWNIYLSCQLSQITCCHCSQWWNCETQLLTHHNMLLYCYILATGWTRVLVPARRGLSNNNLVNWIRLWWWNIYCVKGGKLLYIL